MESNDTSNQHSVGVSIDTGGVLRSSDKYIYNFLHSYEQEAFYPLLSKARANMLEPAISSLTMLGSKLFCADTNKQCAELEIKNDESARKNLAEKINCTRIEQEIAYRAGDFARASKKGATLSRLNLQLDNWPLRVEKKRQKLAKAKKELAATIGMLNDVAAGKIKFLSDGGDDE